MLGVALDDDGAVESDDAPAGLRFFAALLLSLLEPAAAPADSREALPAEAPETSELLERGDAPVRLEGKLLESLVEGAADCPAGAGLALPPAAFGEFWAKALVAAPAAARAATA